MMTTAELQIRAAAEQLRLIVDAIDARDQQARGFPSHVPIPTDADLKRFAQIGLAHLGAKP